MDDCTGFRSSGIQSYSMKQPELCFRSPIEPGLQFDKKPDETVGEKPMVERRNFLIPDVAIIFSDLSDPEATTAAGRDVDALMALNIPTLELVNREPSVTSPMYNGRPVVAGLPSFLEMQADEMNGYLFQIIHPFSMEAKKRKYQCRNQQETYGGSWWENGQSSPIADNYSAPVDAIYVGDDKRNLLEEEVISPLHPPSLPEVRDVSEKVDVIHEDLACGIPPLPPPPEYYSNTSNDVEKGPLIHESSTLHSGTDVHSWRHRAKTCVVLALPLWIFIVLLTLTL